jgi:hypothetical protein
LIKAEGRFSIELTKRNENNLGDAVMKRLCILLWIVLVGGILPTILRSQGTFKGYMINEYYYVSKHHDNDIKGNHGFWFRRIYFTYDNKLADNLKMRLRFELNSPGDFLESRLLTPYVKDVWLNYNLGGIGHELIAGIQPSPNYSNIMDIWGYRALEKPPCDLQRFASTRDFGVALKGNLNSGKTITYHVMYGNGSAKKAEVNRGKILYTQIGFKPVKGLFLELYADYETGNEDQRNYMYQGFASYTEDWGRIGIQYSALHLKSNDEQETLDLFSIFSVLKVSEKVECILRYDKMFDANPQADKIAYIHFSPDAPSNLVIGALSWQAAKNVWIIPNIKYVFYSMPDEGEKPGDDLYLNMTLWFKF